MDAARSAAVARAKARLDRLDLYPAAVRVRRLRVAVVPWAFRLPWLRRFDGYAAHGLILLRDAAAAGDDDLLTHELCHVWQMQHHPLAMPLSYLVHGYTGNPYEEEASAAVEATRSGAAASRTGAPASPQASAPATRRGSPRG